MRRDLWIGIDPKVTLVGLKQCSKCMQRKVSNEFSLDLASVDGLNHWCKKCHIQNQRLKKFGIELPDGSICAICSSLATCVDHDHKTGRTRGFLCQAHNLGLGKFKDNIKHLENAIKYLEKYQ